MGSAILGFSIGIELGSKRKTEGRILSETSSVARGVPRKSRFSAACLEALKDWSRVCWRNLDRLPLVRVTASIQDVGVGPLGL